LPVNFGIVDLFAGPGGLGEGFVSSSDAERASFRIGISVEKETSAHQTLTLRAFLRAYRQKNGCLPKQFIDFHAGLAEAPDWSTVDLFSWKAALEEARCLELGDNAAGKIIDAGIARVGKEFDDSILIGGPPCQAYSLVGRARSKGKIGYVPEKDERHYLFREYIRVLNKLRPAAFVLENVKGMLSSTVESRFVFEMLIEDLRSVGNRRGQFYELCAVRVENGKAFLSEAFQPSDFIVRAEDFGIPQRRHRVFIIGIRSDLRGGIRNAFLDIPKSTQCVDDVIGSLPTIRSGISRGDDCSFEWRNLVANSAKYLIKLHAGNDYRQLRRELSDVVECLRTDAPVDRASRKLPKKYGAKKASLHQWLERPGLRAIAQHETRSHMAADLCRYLFVASFGKSFGYSPKAEDFHQLISPDHKNWNTGIFSDRFRVQLSNEPSTTITSHIAKDGHYFIHPDPAQCRSLTVREAARLQTFPDDYFFMGNRTQQYVQVGNAVPPYLANQIAGLLARALT